MENGVRRIRRYKELLLYLYEEHGRLSEIEVARIGLAKDDERKNAQKSIPNADLMQTKAKRMAWIISRKTSEEYVSFG